MSSSRVAKKVRIRNPSGCYYGTREVSSIIACFEGDLIRLHNSGLDRNGKAWYRHQDRIRLAAAQAIMDVQDAAKAGDVPSNNSNS